MKLELVLRKQQAPGHRMELVQVLHKRLELERKKEPVLHK